MSFSEDPTGGGIPGDDPTQQAGGPEASGDPLQGTEVGATDREDPTGGNVIGEQPYDDPTEGIEVGETAGEDPTS
jgi:hypothetical protein